MTVKRKVAGSNLVPNYFSMLYPLLAAVDFVVPGRERVNLGRIFRKVSQMKIKTLFLSTF
jgi:hypothetical protein